MVPFLKLRSILAAPWRGFGFFVSRIPRPLIRAAAVGGTFLLVLLAVFVLVMRWSVLPVIEQYRPEIERKLSDSLHLPVKIESLRANWNGFRPRLSLAGLQLFDAHGRAALRLERVEAELGWLSLPTASLRFNRLEVVAPALSIRRETDGRIYVAGIEVKTDSRGTDVSDWVLSQSSMVIRGASIEWTDALRGAPPLELRAVNFRLDNSGNRHRFGFQAEPPKALAARLDLRGDLRGRDVADLGGWSGQVYAELDEADLAGWRPWVDYPPWMPHGAGGLRMWTRFAERKITEVVADMGLRGVSVRLAESLPVLSLDQMSGRVSARLPAIDGEPYEFGARGLSLLMKDGTRLAPTDFQTRWVPASSLGKTRGEFSASVLDFESLARIADFVPLDAGLRERLARFAPRGKMREVKLGWGADAGAIRSFSLRANFSNLGLAAIGLVPGFEGLSGSVDANEKGGWVKLASQRGAVDLPAVFPQYHIPIDDLESVVQWTVNEGVIEASLQGARVANADAAAYISGRWRGRAGEAGMIDLSANLSRARADAVWKYLPKTVGERARGWVQTAFTAGESADARLRLKGRLDRFPFDNASDGSFQVIAKVAGVTLDYAPNWPRAENIEGELVFEGRRMSVRASSGTILGAQLKDVSAEIRDLVTPDRELNIAGRADGPTAEFLKYLIQSPLAERVGRFAEGVQASGAGRLDIKLSLPLARMAESRVNGEFSFTGNRLVLAPGAPAITEAGARLVFSENALSVRDGVGNVFGSPLTMAGQTRMDGAFTATAQGRLAMSELRRALDAGALDHLSGAAGWTGFMTIRKGAVTGVIESSLQGISSSLPAPFNKPAGEAMPLRLEFSDLPASGGVGRDQLRATLGRALAVNILRRREGGRVEVERGVIALGETPSLPEKGLLVSAAFKSFDYPAWARVLTMGERRGAPMLPVTAISARAAVATFAGQLFNDVQLTASGADGLWQARLSSREANGDINYRAVGKGRVYARLKNLSLSDLKAEEGAGGGQEEPSELPALDVVADSFTLKGRNLGRLELQAVNRGALWRMEKLTISSPDGTISGEGQWKAVSVFNPGEPLTQVNLKFESGNLGRMLERVGYPDALRRGSGKLEARLGWTGGPTAIDYPSLSGELKVEASGGQFSKFEPGVGRLLGVLSLQSIPRRITLDFRDVFSEGFAFDSISGTLKVQRGVMSTDDLKIRGPAARVSLKGDVDLAAETQDLRVKVQPTLSDTVAIGAAIANPVAGVATFLAQKVLRDPFEKIFAFEYAVTGNWSDPKVEKLGASEAADEAGGKK